MKLKLINRLKKRSHKELALLQDIVIDIVYEIFPKAVLHGGTAIWRCYQGTRFSEDIDIYLDKYDVNNIGHFKEKLKNRKLELKKFKITDNVIYAKIAMNKIIMRLEVSFLKFNHNKIILKKYETIDGNYISIFTLSAEELIKEKVKAYLSRKFVRDIYDIYVLLNYVEKRKEIISSLKELLLKFTKPIDENILSSLIFYGSCPTAKQIIREIKKWVK